MPYSGAGDKNLPSNVKKLPPTKRRQWVHVFNSMMKEHDDESKAFAGANATVAKKSYVSAGCDYSQVSQAQAGYDPYGATDEAGCANCQWFVSPNKCAIVDGSISPTGMSDLWHEKVDYEVKPIPVMIVAQEAGEGNESAAAAADRFFSDSSSPVARIVPADIGLIASDKTALGAADFAYVDPDGGTHLPIEDVAHVKSAMSRWNQTHFHNASAKAAAKRKIIAAARKHGIEVGDFAKGASALDWLTGAVREVFSRYEPDTGDGELVLFKGTDGQMHFRVPFTNQFRDKVKEIIPEAAHTEYVAWADKSGIYPELWVWHGGPESRIGQCTFVDYVDGFGVAAGVIDPGKEEIAQRVATKFKGVSHGYLGIREKATGEYKAYRTFEISALPKWAAANENLPFGLDLNNKEGASMPFSDAKKAVLRDALGFDDETISSWEKSMQDAQQSLAAAGVEFKETDTPVAPAADGGQPPAASALAAVLKDMAVNQQQLITAVGKMGESVVQVQKDLQKTKDELVADEVAAKIAANPTGVRATDGTVVATTKEAEQKNPVQADAEWFDKQLAADLTTMFHAPVTPPGAS